MDACSRTRKVLAGEAPGPGAGWVCPGGPTASHRVHFSPGVGPYPSRFADWKADDSDSATSQTRPEANHDFLRRLALCPVGATGFEPATSRSRTVEPRHRRNAKRSQPHKSLRL